MIALFCCPRWTRTTAGRTKICSATITPWDNCECKSSAFLYSLQIFHELFSLSFPSSLFFFPFFSFQKPYNHLIFNYLQGCLFSFFARFVFFKKYSFSFHFSRSSLSSGGVLLLSATQKSLQYHSFSAVKGATFRLNNNSFEPQKC